MKKIKVLVCLVFILPVFACPARAATDVIAEQAEALDIDGLKKAVPDGADEFMDDVDVTNSSNLGKSLGKIISEAAEKIPSLVKSGAKSAVMLLAAVLLCGIAQNVFEGTNSQATNYVPLAGALAITAIAVGDIKALIGLGSATIDSMDSFSKALLPTLAAAAAAGGAPASSSAKYLATALFSDVLMSTIHNFLLPVVYAYIAAVAADAVVGGGTLSRIASFLKYVITWTLTIILGAFVAYISLSGVISGSADEVAVKAAKTTISAVPVVGSMISDAAETILAGAKVLRNAIGIFGAVAIIAICIVPFLSLGVHYILYKLSAAVSATVGDDRMVKLIDGIGGAFGIILGMTAASALLLFVSVISTVSAVKI
ncbi:MAG: stage III sporulation protein AE [Oscillospiraceae bacterium]|jgi:stage III sporulation protein AE